MKRKITELTDGESVRRAIREYDLLGAEGFRAKYGFGEATRYLLIHEGKEYDSKAIAGVAYGVQFPTEGALRSSEFSGGLSGAAPILKRLGFEIHDRQQPSVADRSRTELDSGSSSDSRFADLADRLLVDASFLETIDKLLKDRRQVIFYGPPGTGKTYIAREIAREIAGADAVTLVQFHPSYAYEDFLEGYRPDPISNGFHLVDGPLKKAALRANESDGPHFLVIDEINRGNVAKVFGELYFLLEYRDEAIQLQYSSEPFTLPDNLYLIGTMNTADRSIALIDAALRRRFHFVGFFPQDSASIGLVLARWLERHKPGLSWIADVVAKANTHLDRHGAIGPSHFLKEDLDEAKVELIWSYSILPYIEEIFFGDEDRLDEFRLQRLRTTIEQMPD